jgi:hypothetical protein
VIDWPDALITPEVEGETHEMNEKAQAFKIQEARKHQKGLLGETLSTKNNHHNAKSRWLRSHNISEKRGQGH